MPDAGISLEKREHYHVYVHAFILNLVTLGERPSTDTPGTQVYKDLRSTIAPFAFILSEVVHDEFCASKERTSVGQEILLNTRTIESGGLLGREAT